jgi:hypothetical protein
VLFDQIDETADVFVCLRKQVRQTSVLLLIDEASVTLFILRLSNKGESKKPAIYPQMPLLEFIDIDLTHVMKLANSDRTGTNGPTLLLPHMLINLKKKA